MVRVHHHRLKKAQEEKQAWGKGLVWAMMSCIINVVSMPMGIQVEVSSEQVDTQV